MSYVRLNANLGFLSKKVVVLGLVFLWMNAFAQVHPRMSAFSNAFVTQVHSQNNNDRLSYADQFDWLFFLDRTLAFNLTWNIGADDEHRHSLSLGLNKYFGRFTEVCPFVQAHFSFLYSPINEIGWFAGTGVEWNLRRLTDNDNLRLSVSTGVTQWIIKDEEDIYRLDLLKIGMGWHF